MSQVIGKELTEDLFQRLSGEDVTSKLGKIIVLVTVDQQGWPHPAMLSYYEVVAKNRSRIDLAIGKASTTGKNLRRTGKVTLLVTDSGVNYYLKGNAHELSETMEGVSFMSLFRAEIDQILEDQEPGAVITSGVTFHRPDKKGAEGLIEKVFHGVREAL